ncbi:MAG TPA: hypothetical protein VID29_05420 [Solirubrobacteraceae bacterium]|jgi:hypothetical protein
MGVSEDIRRAGGDVVWTATGHEPPVFLDERGRRRRWVLAGGALTGGMSALWLGGLIAGAIGFSSIPFQQARQAPFAHRSARPGAVFASAAVGHRRRLVALRPARHATELDRVALAAVSRGLVAAS